MPKVSSLRLEKSGLSIQGSPLRSEHSTASVHKIAKACGSLSEEKRCSHSDLPRRYSYNRIQNRGNTTVHRNGHEPTRISGIHNQQGKVDPQTNSGVNLSGLHHQLSQYDSKFASRQSNRHPITVSPTADSIKCYSPSHSSNFGYTRSGSSSDMESPSPLPHVTSTTDTGIATKSKQLYESRDSITTIQTGAPLVGSGDRIMQWQPCCDSSSRSYHLHGSFETRVGRNLLESTSQREMVCFRETPAHQFFGIEKCFSINSSTDKRQTFNNGVPQHGQHNCGGLRQSPGRDTFTQTTSTCPAVVELVRPEGHSSSRTSRPRQIEQPRRPGVSSICGQQRLDVKSQPHQALIERLQNGPLCLEAYTPASVLCQLETGSPRLPLRCIQSQLAGTQGLRVSPVQLDSKGPGQNNIRSSRSFVSSARLASPTVVASTTPSTDTATNPVTSVTTLVNRPSRTSSDPPNVPSPTLGRIPYLLQRYQTEGLPTNVAELLIAAIRPSTHKTYESSWKRWRSWCCARKINPISASLKDLLTFLTECFDSGLQYRSINVIRSTLSGTHPKIDVHLVGQHPYVKSLLKGILNKRPPKPRYSQTWDVSTVVSHLVRMGDNSELSLKHLSWKLATIFAITCPKRASSFAHLDLNHYRSAPEGIIFTLKQTKTTRPDEPASAIISAFPQDTRLCPVACFKQYIKSTSKLRATTDNDPQNLFLFYIKPHRPVSPSTIARWIRELLAEAGIDVSIFKAHSVRGASTTAAANASVPLDEILKMADCSAVQTPVLSPPAPAKKTPAPGKKTPAPGKKTPAPAENFRLVQICQNWKFLQFKLETPSLFFI